MTRSTSTSELVAQTEAALLTLCEQLESMLVPQPLDDEPKPMPLRLVVDDTRLAA